MASMNNMPRLALKRAFMDIITDQLGLELNAEHTKLASDTDATVWIVEMNETFTPIRGSGNGQLSSLNIEFQVFSSRGETAVHKAVYELIKIDATNPRLIETGIRIMDINPVASNTSWEDDSSDGYVVATLTLKIDYQARF
ncbi:hypothetical protein NDJ61_11075 [Escherichia coli]|uniref:hypothetical protein n=1 Tax=Escherichia coli TaxID=562 RepID=UPI00201D0C99|nr:hypothetical protein [Escherichia coli]MCP8776028.1 hypothetical protein [Escherichia coli]